MSRGLKKAMRHKDTSARERILEVADELFYREGIRAIGVDRIIAESGVAKTTFYRYFPSKDDLIVTYLEERNRCFWELFDEAIAPHPNDAKAQLLAVFEWLEKLIAKPECYGCPFLNITTEFPELDNPGHQVAITHKRKILNRLVELASLAGLSHAQELSTYLLLLIDGAFAQRRLFGSTDVGSNLKAAAITLMNAYLSNQK